MQGVCLLGGLQLSNMQDYIETKNIESKDAEISSVSTVASPLVQLQ